MKTTEYDYEYIAKLLKFYLQFNNPYLKFIIPLKRVSSKVFYSKYKKEINLLCDVFSKYNLDIIKYIRFFTEVLKKTENDVKNDIVNMATINQYIDWLQSLEKQDKVYNYFIKSVKNIAKKCNELGFFSTKDFIRYLIENKKMAEYYITGQISLYYFAAIPNFKKIIPKLDSFSRMEFSKIYNRFEMYNAEITSAFMRKTNQKVNPIKITDDLIFKLRNSTKV